MIQKFLLSVLLAFTSIATFGQNEKMINYSIKEVSKAEVSFLGELQINAVNAKYYKMDISTLAQEMEGVMHREHENSGFIGNFKLPHPDGNLYNYRAKENSTMDPVLGNIFPEIKTYDASGVNNGSTVKWDITPHGLHAMIMIPGESTVFIDPAIKGNTQYYIVYEKKDFITTKTFECDFDLEIKKLKKPAGGTPKMFGTCQLRTYRLALSATGEYTMFHGGTVALAQAAQVTSMNRVNGLYERDMAITMVIIANNNLIVYTNAATDPFTNGTPGTMINQNQTNTDAVIGSANYDIGHVFGTNSGGLAGLGVVCTGLQKARGVTGSAAPIGDPFDIDYVAHEIGHQFGANHTQNNNCNRNNATAVETGSGNTIMGYAGICAPNTQNNSNDHFSGKSLEEISFEILSTGHTCEATTALANSAPIILSTAGNINVPISTPFALTATVSDADGDPVSYNWEQMDIEVSTQPPVATSTGGPNFRSNPSSTNPTRYFPSLASLATNGPYTWEVLPSVARVMDFRVTVRDNSPGAGGCNDHEDITVTTVSTAGPFIVNYPTATGISWAGASSQTVTWSVANTNVAPVACGFVDILLSTNGGLTYPTVLATNVPNDGSQVITVPNTPSTTCRIMVICSNGTFFDISNNNFTITASTFDYTLTVTPSTVSVCQPSNATYNVTIGSIGGYNSPVTLSVSGVPAGATSNFSVSPVTPAGTSVLTISNTGSAAPGSYTLTITGNSVSGTKVSTVTLNISSGATAAVTLTSPANAATGVAVPTNFTWSTSPGTAITYEIQIATDAAFTSIVDQATGIVPTNYTSSLLATSTTYYWRVRATSGCGTSAWSSTFNFTTNTCSTTAATGLPLTITGTGTPTITSTINIPAGGTITDVNVLNLVGTHTYINDLVVTLTSPQGTVVTLFSQICNDQDNFNINFDDAAASATLPCPPTGGGTFQPLGVLSAFNGQNSAGNWILTISDVADQDGGALTSWSLQICENPPVPCNNPSVPAVSGINTICSGASTTLTIASGILNDATNWTWYTGSCGGTIAGTGTSLTITPATTTTYFVRGTGGCVSGGTCAQYTVTVNPLPTVNAGVDQTICVGSSVTLSGSGASTYTWNNGVLNGVSFSPAATATYTVTGTNGNGCINTDQVAVTVNPLPSAITLLTPANAATGVAIPTSFTWSASAIVGATYSIQIATDPGFTNIVDQATGLAVTNYTSVLLSANTAYYWRINVTTSCGSTGFGAAFNFTTTSCVTYSATGLPITISATGTPTITSTINVPVNGTINDVNVIDLIGTHTRMGDLTFTLTSPGGTTITLMAAQCGNNDNFNLDFDQSAAAGAVPCPPTTGLAYQPSQSLNGFNGQNSSGNWILTVTDGQNMQGGSLTGWSLQICTDPSVSCTNPTQPNLSGTTAVCAGQSTTLSVATGTLNSATSWNWYSGSCGGALVGTGTSITVSPSTTTTYFVRGEDGAGCVIESSVLCGTITVNVTALPSAPVATVTNNCGSSVLSATGLNLLWSTGATSATITVTSPGTYTVTQTIGGCASAPASATAAPLAVPAAPVVSITNNCGSSLLTATGSSLLWSTGATTASITVTVANTYTVTQTVGGCTSLPATLNAAPGTPPATPVVTVTNNCGNSVLTASGSGHLWSNGATTASITVTSSGTYTVTQTVSGCTSSAGSGIAAPIALPASPVVSATDNCGSSILTATGSNLLWSTGATTATITVTSPGAYTVTQTVGGCTSTPSSVTAAPLAVPSAPLVSVTNNCGSSLLAATGSNLLWSTNETTSTITVSTPGDYTVTQTIGGCTSSQVTIAATPASAPTISQGSITEPTTCGGSNGSITVLGSGNGTLIWTGVNSGNASVTLPFTISGISAGSYSIQFDNGCASNQLTVVVNGETLPAAPTVVVDNKCGYSTLTATGSNLQWSTTETASTITVTTPGTVFVSQTVGGCTSALTSVSPAPLLIPTASFSELADVCINDAPFALSGGSPAGGVYSGTGVSGGNFDPALAGYGTFTIIYTYEDVNGCSDAATQTITVGCASIDEEVESIVNVYPSPSNGILNIIVTNDEFIDLRVYDQAGRLVIDQMMAQESEITVDLSNFADGIYNLVLTTKTNAFNERVILKK
jgi:subtilisin-like proprotein convertase family protein